MASPACLALAQRSAARQALGHGTQGVEGLAVDRLGRRGLQVGGGIADAQCLGARGIAQEAQHGQQLRRAGRLQRLAAHLCGADVAGALPAMVVHLQVVAFLAADFQAVALPQHGLLRAESRGAARSATGPG